MGLSKPIIVNTQQVTVTEQAVDLSGIENTLATIKADASAAKTSAAQAAEAALEGGASPCIVTAGTGASIKVNNTTTLLNITGKGKARIEVFGWQESWAPTIIIDGVTSSGLNGTTIPAQPEDAHNFPLGGLSSSLGVYVIDVEFAESLQFKVKAVSGDISASAFYQLF